MSNSSVLEYIEHPVGSTLDDHDSYTPNHWNFLQTFGLRIATIFFALTLIGPLDWKFWPKLLHTHWTHFQDIFRLTAATPQYFYAPKWGLGSFRNVFLVLLIATISAAVWSYLDRGRREYTQLYYWLRVLLRYRIAVALIGYGLLQVFPVQFPKLTLSDLYTNYGDLLQWKIYYLTNSVAHAHYEQATGLLEVLGGALLLWRATATIGAIISASLLFNIVLANFAYQLGDHIYATLLFVAVNFLLWYDASRLVNLLVFQRKATADKVVPPLHSHRAGQARLALKSAVIVFLVFYAATVAYGFHSTNWPFPDTVGALSDHAGYYNVREFTVNGRTIPYSLTDPVRWQNVVIEKWNTISVRSNRPLPLEVANPPIVYDESQRTYEFAGNGDRRFYSYTADPTSHTLHLSGKNDPHESIAFQYNFAPDGSLLLTGTDESGNSLHIVLDKIDKQFLLYLGRRHPVSIY